MKEIITSVGIDIGTSTTQLIFSRITIKNMATSYTVPRITIVDTEVFYRSHIYMTPLKDSGNIDAEKIKGIVQSEYEKAGMKPSLLTTGAVIITGETARKDNADEVLSVLSNMAGDFVVATAGPDLEAVLSGRGAGADRISDESRMTVANVDVGGGTSNIAVFNRGNVERTCCLDIGGRLIQVEDGKITYVYNKIDRLAKEHGINIKVGDHVEKKQLIKVADLMADQLAMALGLLKRDSLHKSIYTNNGDAFPENIKVDTLTFSGGVADAIYGAKEEDPFVYGDIGPLLGMAIRENSVFKKIKKVKGDETIRATVVGAGTHTTEVSGSTIRYEKEYLPLKNIPVVRMNENEESNLKLFSERLKEKIDIYTNRSREQCVAIAFSGTKHTTFREIQDLADAIIVGIESYNNKTTPIVTVTENDIGKVLGNALKAKLLKEGRHVISVDNIYVKDGDYIDIGEPVAEGRVVPIVTKTLIFNH